MPLSKDQKNQIVKLLGDKLKGSKAVVIASFTKIPVNTDQELRAQMRQNSADYHVVKKTLLSLATRSAKLPEVDLGSVAANVAIAFSPDEVTAAQLMHKFSKDNEGYKMFTGYLEQKPIDISQLEELAKLPGKKGLLAQVLSSMQAPVSGMVQVLAGSIRQLVYVLGAIRNSKS